MQRGSILAGLFAMLDDEYLHRPLAGFELQPQLFRHSRIDRTLPLLLAIGRLPPLRKLIPSLATESSGSGSVRLSTTLFSSA